MKVYRSLLLILVLMLVSTALAQEEETESLVLADFEGEELFLGKDSDQLDIGFVTWGDAGGNVVLELASAEDELALPDQEAENQVLQVSYDIGGFGGFTHALTDGEEWVSQDWTEYNTLDFWLYGTETGALVQVEIFDNRAENATSDSAERWYYRVEDNFSGWQFISIPFEYFQRRTDWQPGGAPSDGLGLTEVHGYAFAFPAGIGQQVTYIDDVSVGTGEGNVDAPASMTGAAPQDTADADGETTAPPAATLLDLPDYDPDGEWTLVWSDEFDAEAGEPINADYWTCEVGGWGWGNAQLEHNTARTENVVHDGAGHLKIIAREESYLGNDYTSGRCNTMDKVEFTYGRVEARINLPEGQGMWPAFWMLGANFPEIGWPDSGEIDIMENVGYEPRSIHGTIHGPGYSGSGGLGTRYLFDEPVANDFHVFGIEWEPDVIRWTVNGEVFHTATNPDSLYGMGEWVYDHDFFMLINVAVGGNWPGSPDETTVFPQEMLVDWVRVYQRTTEE